MPVYGVSSEHHDRQRAPEVENILQLVERSLSSSTRMISVHLTGMENATTIIGGDKKKRNFQERFSVNV